MPCEHNQSVSTHGKCNSCGDQLYSSKTLEQRALARLTDKGKAELAEMKEVLNHEDAQQDIG